MSASLKDKVAIITGGTSGIGLASVRHFMEEGAKVVCADIQDDKGADLQRELGNDFAYVHADVSDESEVKAMVEQAIAKFGKLDVMFNNAGFGGEPEPLPDMDMENFDRVAGVLIRGVVLGSKYASAQMVAQKSGSIISTASIAGLIGGLGSIAYGTFKGAVVNFTRTAALQLAPYFIRVNCVCPGFIATPIMGERLGVDPKKAEQFAEALRPHFAKRQPIPRPGLPEDIAHMAGFLAGDRSTFITGQALVVDGGVTAGYPMNRSEAVDVSQIAQNFRI